MRARRMLLASIAASYLQLHWLDKATERALVVITSLLVERHLSH